MEKLQMEKVLKELSNISRMAILEEAYETEKMLVAYTKVLRHYYLGKGEVIAASSEFEAIDQLCRYYHLKHNGGVQFEIKEAENLQAMFICRGQLLSKVEEILDFLEQQGQLEQVGVQLQLIEAEKQSLQMVLSGKVSLKAICEGLKTKENILSKGNEALMGEAEQVNITIALA